MNPANTIQCLTELFDINSSLNKTEISQKERLIAQRFARVLLIQLWTVISFIMKTKLHWI